MVQIQDEDGLLEPGIVQAKLTGSLIDGTPFSGEETICVKHVDVE